MTQSKIIIRTTATTRCGEGRGCLKLLENGRKREEIWEDYHKLPEKGRKYVREELAFTAKKGPKMGEG